MTSTAILWPMLAHVALVYAVYVLMYRRRREAVRAGSVRRSQFRENRDEPPESLFVRNNLANQFELPVLFHACCLALFATGAASTVPVVLAWIFIAARYAHAFVHVTSNRIRYRSPIFTVGFVALALMWCWLALALLGLV